MSSIPAPVATSQPLEAALRYAARGWQVLPVHAVVNGRCTCGKDDCQSPGKHPRTDRGVYDATTDPSKIRDWWRNGSPANVAIRTGLASRLLVVDIDGEAGLRAIEDLQRQHGAFPPTATAITGGGGRHFLFRWPEGADIGNLTRVHGLPIDVRGRNGYIVAPPSCHASGQHYVWQADPEAVGIRMPSTDWPARRSPALTRRLRPTRRPS